MNAPEKIATSSDTLGSVCICYAPLIDKKRRAIGTRLTMLSANPGQQRAPIGHVLDAVNSIWSESSQPVLVAPLDAEFDESVLDWKAPRNALLEIPANRLVDPRTQSIAQVLFRDGKRLSLRGRPEVPLPPALLSCFEYALIHVSEERRRTPAAPPAGAVRHLPYIVTGVQTVADAVECFDRDAVACVGWPFDDPAVPKVRPLQPGQAVVLELLRLVRDDADLQKIDQTLRRDPALAFKLLRLVNSAAFNLPVQITSFQHAVMMLGYKKLNRWLSLLLATASREANTFPLMHASIRRGIFLETIGASVNQGADTRDELFITGAFSLLDNITGAPFEQLFELISLSETIVEAVLHRTGPYGPYLTLIEAIERSDPIAVRKQAEFLAIPIAVCNEALLKSLAAAQLLDGEI